MCRARHHHHQTQGVNDMHIAIASNLNRDLVMIPTRRTRRDPVDLARVRTFTRAANRRSRNALRARNA
jgi:hypothetical protein